MNRFGEPFGNKTTGYHRVNLDHAVRLELVDVRGGIRHYRAYDINGEELGRVDRHDVDPEPSGVVPERNGAVLIDFWLKNDGTIDSLRTPIVAWIVSDEVAKPVTCHEFVYDQDVYCVEHADGPWIFPFEGVFETIEEAEKYALERLQEKAKD